VISAAKSEGFTNLANLRLKLDALKAAKTKGDFAQIASLFKRINNITSQAKKQNIEIKSVIDESLLQDPAEKVLFENSKLSKEQVSNFINQDKYDLVFDQALQIKPAIDDFFEKVMVMADDKAIKENRIALLNSVKNIFASFIDFSALQ
jgi:glycyl-tRNA synthetase beta chain